MYGLNEEPTLQIETAKFTPLIDAGVVTLDPSDCWVISMPQKKIVVDDGDFTEEDNTYTTSERCYLKELGSQAGTVPVA